MKKLSFLMALFILLLTIPLGWVVTRSYESLRQEELAEFRFFGEALFDRIEEEMAALILTEEARPVSDYTPVQQGKNSPLARQPEDPFVLGYLQVNADGTLQFPLATGSLPVPETLQEATEELKGSPPLLTRKTPSRLKLKAPKEHLATKDAYKKKSEGMSSLSGKYFQRSPSKKSYLEKEERGRYLEADEAADFIAQAAPAPQASVPAELPRNFAYAPEATRPILTPMEAIPLEDNRLFIFRRVLYGSRTVSQGLVLDLSQYLAHLEEKYFEGEPVAEFARLELTAETLNGTISKHGGTPVNNPAAIVERSFPRPFDTLQASLTAANLPSSPGRSLLNLLVPILGAILLAGLLLIYRSARGIHELSRRRTGFVSSVTHELKTPLTNIRMYADMLQEGIATTPEKQNKYLQTISSESRRLSRLIINVLEFSRLENHSRVFEMRDQLLADAVEEVRAVLDAQLRQEGFTLKTDIPPDLRFPFDREGLIQILINCVENSIKFGKEADFKEILIHAERQGGNILVEIVDKGPGVPRNALNSLFEDFYRVDDSLTRKTKGTGIGLSLVRKLVLGMGGEVDAANNSPSGLTIRMIFKGTKAL
jgi:signal transduction histidine kinase